MNFTITRLAIVVSSIVLPKMADKHLGLTIPLFFCVGVGAISWFCAIILACIERYAEKRDGTTEASLSEEGKFKCSKIRDFKLPFVLMCLI